MPNSVDPRPKPLIIGPTQKWGKYGLDIFAQNVFKLEIVFRLKT